jgi:hypothetical protein
MRELDYGRHYLGATPVDSGEKYPQPPTLDAPRFSWRLALGFVFGLGHAPA